MKALVLSDRERADGLALREVPEPERPSGWVLVRVLRASLNRVDVYMRRSGQGIRHELPMILGLDAVGEVLEADAESGLAPGQKVVLYPALFCGRCRYCLAGDQPLCRRVRYFGEHRDGVFAERIAAPATNLFPVPEDADPAGAACLPTAYLTAFRMLFGKAPLRPAETVLIQGGGGGVAIASLQLARIAGARTILVSRRPEVRRRALELGADAVLDPGEPELWRAVAELTDDEGADMVVENVGAATWGQSLRAVRRGGRVVTCGATTGGMPPAELQRLFIRQIAVFGSTLGSLAEFRALLDLFLRGMLRPVVDRVVPFTRAVEALDDLEAGRQIGKIVLDMTGS
ncbi:MAG TPA: NADPH:quinone reductase [Rhodospirillales bacterium]|nr:NADPH:quinone reductase [Rhodospirillales bacterium]